MNAPPRADRPARARGLMTFSALTSAVVRAAMGLRGDNEIEFSLVAARLRDEPVQNEIVVGAVDDEDGGEVIDGVAEFLACLRPPILHQERLQIRYFLFKFGGRSAAERRFTPNKILCRRRRPHIQPWGFVVVHVCKDKNCRRMVASIPNGNLLSLRMTCSS